MSQQEEADLTADELDELHAHMAAIERLRVAASDRRKASALSRFKAARKAARRELEPV